MKTIKQKIAQLLLINKDKSASLNERKQAMVVAQRLMRKHQLSEDDISEDDISETDNSAYVTIEYPVSGLASYGGSRWTKVLFNIITTNNRVFLLDNDKTLTLFGRQSDINATVEFFSYAFDVAKYYALLDWESSPLPNKYRYKFLASYGAGYVKGVATLYKTLQTEDETGTAIIHNQYQSVVNAFQGAYKLSRQRKTTVFTTAYESGEKQGKQLRNSIEATKPNAYLLKG